MPDSQSNFELPPSALLAYKPRVSSPFRETIDAATRYCAVYGHPVRHSASPAMQNAGIAKLGLNWRYLAFEVHPDDLRPAIEGAKAMRFIGLNLTVPHKILAVDLVDAIEESATLWGAVNTIRFEGKDGAGNWKPLSDLEGPPAQIRSHGFNTDAEAITRSLKEDLGIDLQGKRVLVLGAGGAGKTAALKIAEHGVAELFLVNRTESRAEEVAREIKERVPTVRVEIGYPRGRVDLLLNATSLGLKNEDVLPFDAKSFSLGNAAAVYDMIYRPAETALLRAAKTAGCRVSNGIGMLLYQGAKALELWSGCEAPIEVMRKALESNVYGTS